jgi:hypothetical protein
VIIIALVVAEPKSIPFQFAAALNGALFGAISGGIGAALEYLAKKRFTGRFIAVGVFLGFIFWHSFEEASRRSCF